VLDIINSEGNMSNNITRQDVELWATNYREAIDTLMWFIDKDYTKEDMIESIQEFVNELEGENIEENDNEQN
tara:strand:+ start:327 stop:542 length:216 start_codon:yes stop_codon:yes gene_type:complete